MAEWRKDQYSYALEVARGNVPGQSLVHKFGKNPAVPNGSFAFVTILGQTAHILSAAGTVRVKAGNAADAAGGNGAREITVQGIDDSFNEVTEALATAGASPSSASTTSFWRVHRAWVSAAGTYGAANTAAVVIENSGGGTDILTIAIEEGQTQDAVYTVPTGKTGYLLSVDLMIDASKAADIALYTRDNIDDTTAPLNSKRLKHYWDGVLGAVNYHPATPSTTINGKSDIWIEAQGGGAGTEVSAEFEILLVDD